MPQNLIQSCTAARDRGLDFPAIWEAVLSRHPLVIGRPAQAMNEGRPQLEIQLATGQRLVFDSESGTYGLWPFRGA